MSYFNLQKTLIFPVCLIFSSIGNSQVDQGREYLTDAFSEYETSHSNVNSAINDLSYVRSNSSITILKQYADDAESYVITSINAADDAVNYSYYAESEANSSGCSSSSSEASYAHGYFGSAQDDLRSAQSKIVDIAYEDDDEEIRFLIGNTLANLSDAIDNLNRAASSINDSSNYLSDCDVSSNSMSCDKLQDRIKDNGYRIKRLRSYTLDSEWLYEVSAYEYQDQLYVIAEIKVDYSKKNYIWCNVPSRNWRRFKNSSDEYGEAFHEYIMEYHCGCY